MYNGSHNYILICLYKFIQLASQKLTCTISSLSYSSWSIRTSIVEILVLLPVQRTGFFYM